MAKNKHMFDMSLKKGHKKARSEDGGACLNRHVTAFKKDNSCSHRWQAYRTAEKNNTWYNWPAYEELAATATDKSFITNQWGKISKKMTRPNKNEWDLGETTLYKNGRSVKNFVKWSKCPYWHNAHHLIPNSILNNCIYEAAKEAKSFSLYKLVRTSLLEAEYNLNHNKNMVILPMSKEIAAALGLPRHISGIGGKGPRFDHPAYSDKVRQKVEKIVLEFAEQIKEEKHDIELPEFSKSQLETVAENILNELRLWQSKEKAGSSLDEMPAEYSSKF